MQILGNTGAHRTSVYDTERDLYPITIIPAEDLHTMKPARIVHGARRPARDVIPEIISKASDNARLTK